MEINATDNYWQAFALSGDPLAYLDYSRSKLNSGYKGRKSEDKKSCARRG